MPIQRAHRCASVEKFAEMSLPEQTEIPIPSGNNSASTIIPANRPSPPFNNSPPNPNAQNYNNIPYQNSRPVSNNGFVGQQLPVNGGPNGPPLRPIIRPNPNPYYNGPQGPQGPPREITYQPNNQLVPLNQHKPYDRLTEVYSNSGDTAEFASNLRRYINNTIPFWVWLMLAIFEIVVGIASIFIGSYNYSMCEIEPHTPLYLILSGSALVIHGMIRMGKSIPSPKKSKRTARTKPKKNSLYPSLCMHGIEALAVVYILTCVILGCVWVFGQRTRYVQYMPQMFESDYCDKTLYWMAWWSVTLHLVIFTIITLALIIIVSYGSLVSEN